MRKSSAITLTTLVIVVVLTILLTYTAYYINSIMLKPVVNMQSEENSLRCYFVLSNLVGGDYFRLSSPPPENSLREKLVNFYNISISQDPYNSLYHSEFERALTLSYGDAEIVIARDKAFWTAVKAEGLSPECTIEIYGPFYSGVAGLFTTQGAGEEISKWEEKIYGD